MEPSNGYVVGDGCVFGAEVLVIRSERVNECLRLVGDAASVEHEWTISDISNPDGVLCSEEFDVGNYKWNIVLYPNEDSSVSRNRYLSMFVAPRGIPPHQRVKAEVFISVKTRLNDSVFSKKCTNWFTSSCEEWGYPEFVSTADVSAKSFLVDDCFSVEVGITVQAVVLEAPEI
ncbi:BTB/POZ and MATH domain-containing protein 6-like [Salvia splendens]|uniref:BTB/POZ and MATH domain-containing protein 6-like n=1 Tax=Salvia splendens TaxID=180675 RepID=UPI001C263130|nr:BTB/POZ and MATH domain-containing protein 6-like [Salvia splendens]